MHDRSATSTAATFALLFAFIFALHLPLLRLPYFWDEAGYYVPAARDLLLTGSIIPQSTPSNAHPPLVMAYLAACWRIFGYSPLVTRTAMLLVAAFALLGVFRLSAGVANRHVAAAGLTLWGLEAYLTGRWRATAFWFSLAVLAKETAVLAPVALLAWEIVSPWLGLQIQREPDRLSDPQVAKAPRPSFAWMLGFACLLPVLVLCGWYAYHYVRTRYVFGNPEFFRYNVQ